MTKKLLLTKNFIPKKFLDKILIKKLSEKFQKIIINIFNEVIEEKKVLNILNDQFKFNFKTEDLKKSKTSSIHRFSKTFQNADHFFCQTPRKLKPENTGS